MLLLWLATCYNIKAQGPNLRPNLNWPSSAATNHYNLDYQCKEVTKIHQKAHQTIVELDWILFKLGVKRPSQVAMMSTNLLCWT